MLLADCPAEDGPKQFIAFDEVIEAAEPALERISTAGPFEDRREVLSHEAILRITCTLAGLRAAIRRGPARRTVPLERAGEVTEQRDDVVQQIGGVSGGVAVREQHFGQVVAKAITGGRAVGEPAAPKGSKT